MVNITLVETDARDIDLIKPLWQQLNEQHRMLSTHFTHHYETFTFEQRKGDLLHKVKNGLMRIDLAQDVDTNLYVGYGVSTIIKDRGSLTGEVESIYVEKPYRLNGVGDMLMRKSLEWMDMHGVKAKRVSVGAGNEWVLPFYARYGFYPRSTALEQVKK